MGILWRANVAGGYQDDLGRFGKKLEDLVVGPELRIVFREEECLTDLRFQINHAKKNRHDQRGQAQAYEDRHYVKQELLPTGKRFSRVEFFNLFTHRLYC